MELNSNVDGLKEIININSSGVMQGRLPFSRLLVPECIAIDV